MFSADEELLQKSTGEVMTVLVHMKKLLRARNKLCSPLLRLPTEILIYILSFIMAGLDPCPHPLVWMSIYCSCHLIHNTMRSATVLWWRVDCTYVKTADFIFTRSNGGPRVIFSDLRSGCEQQCLKTERLLDIWRDQREFRGHQLHTLKFYGSPSSFSHFSWILERRLPRLEHLIINIVDSTEDPLVEPWPDPVPLELPMGISLRVLNLRNVALPWASQAHLFGGLRELHLSFKDCEPTVTIPEDELFGIFDASPQLERLSLLRVGHEVQVGNGRPLPPKRVIQLRNLTSLSLDNDPIVVKYTLAYMELPVISSLHIRSLVAPHITQTPTNLFFPDGRLPARLFTNPPRFAVGSIPIEGPVDSNGVSIGSFTLWLDFPPGHGELGGNSLMSHITQLAPPSITTLVLDHANLGEREWRDFFRSHPEIRSIQSTVFYDLSESLWDALSPAREEDTGILCPKLESIFIALFTWGMSFTALADCLRERQHHGFKLRRLVITDMERLSGWTNAVWLQEEISPVVETFETNIKCRPVPKVIPVRVCESGVC